MPPLVTPTVSVVVAGLGQMGRGVARRLDAAGLLVGAHDVDPQAIDRAALSTRAARGALAALVGAADALLFLVPATRDVRAALDDATLRPGQTIVDLTTSDPEESRALAAELDASGVGYIDAAMTGGAAAADDGRLTLMVGGAPRTLERVRPVLELIASRIINVGPAGAGHAMKLVHNMILHTIFLANCEGLRLAARAGIDPALAVEVLNAGNARSFVSEVRFPRDILSGTMEARSYVGTLEKDLGLAVDWAARLEAPTPFGSMTRALLAEAVTEGMSQTDFAHLFPRYEALAAGLEARR